MRQARRNRLHSLRRSTRNRQRAWEKEREARPQVPEWEEIATTIFEHGEQAIRKAKTVDQTLSSLDQDVNAMLEKRRYLLAQEKR